jgi:hypothetical protein
VINKTVKKKKMLVCLAAHCIYDENAHKPMEPSLLKVAVGKYTRSWNSVDPYEQKRDVSITISSE